MPNRDPLGEIEKRVVRIASAALTFTALISVIGREWGQIIGVGSHVEGVIAIVSGILIASVAAALRR